MESWAVYSPESFRRFSAPADKMAVQNQEREEDSVFCEDSPAFALSWFMSVVLGSPIAGLLVSLL